MAAFYVGQTDYITQLNILESRIITLPDLITGTYLYSNGSTTSWKDPFASPTLVTPVLGVATATSINKLTITTPATSAVLTIADGKTLTISNTLTFTGTDSSSVAFGGGGTVVYTANKLSVHASTTSAELAGIISDETGTGALVFGTSPAITTSLTTPSTSFDLINTTAATVNFAKAATTLSIGASSGTTTINNDLTISGNFIVNGTTTTINATTVSVDDINIELGSVASPTDITAAGGGITLKGLTDKTIAWSAANGWTSSETFNLATGRTFKIAGTDVLSASTLGSGVISSSLTSVGTLSTGIWQGTVIAGQYGGTGVANTGKTITLGGNLTTSGAFATTLTTTATTSLTLPTSGTLATTTDTQYIGTTAVTLNRASANLALTGILSVTLPGSTSGSVQVIPAAVAGTGTVLTLPAVTGTVVTTGDTGTVTNTMLTGSIDNAKLSNSSITVGTTAIALGASSTTLAGLTSVTSTSFTGALIGNASTVTNGVYTTDTGTVTNAMLAGSIANSKLTNSSIIVTAGTGMSGGGSVSLGGTVTLTNAGVLSVNGNTGAITGIATTAGTLAQFAATTSSQLAGVISDETGTGALVFATSPTLVTPTLGIASATTINKVAITTPATGSTLTIAEGKTLTASNTLTFTGTDSSSVAFGGGGTVTYTSNKLSAFSATTSAELAGVLSDETGYSTGALAVFSKSPSIDAPTITGHATIESVAVTGATGTGNLVFSISPTLTGTPLSTTAVAGTNTTQIATTAFVQTAVSNLVASAPAALDTLNELAAALGNDANFSTTISTSIGLKAPIASPTFTGTATIPTLNLTNALAVSYGGTGLTTAPTNGQIDIGSTGAGFVRTTLTAGSGISITNAAGSITISSTSGGGSVTSVAQTFTGGLISVAGSPITGAGTLALTVAGTSGGIPYFSSASTWASSAALTQYGVIYGGGAGGTPVATAAGTTGQVLTATTGGAPSWTSLPSGSISVTGGDLTLSGNTGTAITNATLATVNSNIGTYNNVTVNAKGLVTAASNVAYLTAEADTLATVTGRGATTSTAVTLSGGLSSTTGTFSGAITVNDGNVQLYKSQTVDMSNTGIYSTSNYYPVTIGVPTGGAWIEVQNNLDSNVPSWSTHAGGFTLNLRWWTTGSGWGITQIKRRVEQYFECFASSTICGGITQMSQSSNETVWLRGGGTYFFKFSRNLTAIAQSTTYTINGQSVTPTSSAQNTVWNSSTGAHQSYFDAAYVSGNAVLHADNYYNYSPTLTGGNASGTWNISISGNALTATTTNELLSKYYYNANVISDTTAAYTLSPGVGSTTVAMHSSHGLFGGYATTLTMSGYERYGAYQISGEYNAATPRLAIRNYIQSSGTWNSWTTIITNANYNNYSPTLTGGNASGTWGININGSLTASAPQLAAATESNSIYITAPSYTTNTPVKLLNFDWYSNVFSMGNIRGVSTGSNGFGIYYTASGGSRTEIARFGTDSSLNVVGALKQNGNQVLHADNYYNHALPLSGGTMTGSIAFSNVVGNKLAFYNTGTDKYGIDVQSSELRIFSGAQGNATGGITLGKHDGTTFTEWMRIRNNGAVVISGNQVLHADNYYNYSPTLTGGNASGTWNITASNASNLNSKASSAFWQRVHYGTSAGNIGYYKISILSTTSWMLSFTIRLYQGYTSYDIRISGYNYGSNYWYTPQASLMDSSTTSIDVKFGYDSAWNLWVAVPAGYYTGLDILDIVNGYTQVDQNWSDQFTVVNQATLTGTVQTTVTAYRPAKYNEALRTDNYSSYALPLSGGTIAGNGYVDFGPNSNWSVTLRVGGNGYGDATRASVVTTNGNLHLDGTSGSGIYLNWYNTSTNGTYFGNGNGGQVGRVDGGGNASFSGTGTFSGTISTTGITATGDITTYRSGSPTTGVIYLGNNSGTRYLYYDGTNYNLNGANLYVNGTQAVTNFGTWGISINGNAATVGGLYVHAARNNEANKVVRTDGTGYLLTGYINSTNGDENNNSNPDRVWGTNGGDSFLRTYRTSALSVNYASTAGNAAGSFSIPGSLIVGNTTSSDIFMVDTDEGNRRIHCNSGRIGFLNSSNGWGAYCDNYGNWFANNLSGTNTGDQTNISGNAGNTSSISNALGNSHTWTGANYFRSNRNTDSSSPPLQAYSDDGGGAIMSFHRAGNYAINMGLDSDNIFRLQGWSSGFRWSSDGSGNFAIGGNIYTNANYGYGLIGLYNSTIFQGVFAMGDAYKLSAGGGISNLYGMTWSYPSAGGIAGNLSSHGVVVAINGGFGSCMSYNVTASGNVTAYSDERLKKNWEPLCDNFVEKLAEVKVGTYERTDQPVVQVGVSAQSLEKVIPEAVLTASDDMQTKHVSYGNAALASAVMLAKEIVELKQMMKQMQEEIAELKRGA